MLSKTAFLILSCDSYSELWDTHFKCLDRYWPDCPFPKYILTNLKDPNRQDITAIKVGQDLTWSANLIKALEILRPDYQYVLVTFDDLFLKRTVNNHQLESALQLFSQSEGEFLQLIKWLKRPIRVNSSFGKIEPGSLYRPNCVYAIWDIEVLQNMLVPGENAWEFERNGAARSERYDRFYAVLKSVFHYRNSVIKGKILRGDARRFNLRNTRKFSVMSRCENVHFYLKFLAFKVFLAVVPRKKQPLVASWKDRITGK